MALQKEAADPPRPIDQPNRPRAGDAALMQSGIARAPFAFLQCISSLIHRSSFIADSSALRTIHRFHRFTQIKNSCIQSVRNRFKSLRPHFEKN